MGLFFEIFSGIQWILANHLLYFWDPVLVVGKAMEMNMALCLHPVLSTLALRSDIRVAAVPQWSQKHNYWLQKGLNVFIYVVTWSLLKPFTLHSACMLRPVGAAEYKSLVLKKLVLKLFHDSGHQRRKKLCWISLIFSFALGIKRKNSLEYQKFGYTEQVNLYVK